MQELSNGQVVFLALVAGWLVTVVVGMVTSHLRKTQAHRERLAMIERGLAPPPELYPDKYGAPPWAQGPRGPQHWMVRERRGPHPTVVARKIGAMIICVGAGIGWLLYVLVDHNTAMAVGGLFAAIGVAFVVISFNLGLPPTQWGREPGHAADPGPPPQAPSDSPFNSPPPPAV